MLVCGPHTGIANVSFVVPRSITRGTLTFLKWVPEKTNIKFIEFKA